MKLETHEDVHRLITDLREKLGIEDRQRRRDMRCNYGHRPLTDFSVEAMQN